MEIENLCYLGDDGQTMLWPLATRPRRRVRERRLYFKKRGSPDKFCPGREVECLPVAVIFMFPRLHSAKRSRQEVHPRGSRMLANLFSIITSVIYPSMTAPPTAAGKGAATPSVFPGRAFVFTNAWTCIVCESKQFGKRSIRNPSMHSQPAAMAPGFLAGVSVDQERQF